MISIISASLRSLVIYNSINSEKLDLKNNSNSIGLSTTNIVVSSKLAYKWKLQGKVKHLIPLIKLY